MSSVTTHNSFHGCRPGRYARPKTVVPRPDPRLRPPDRPVRDRLGHRTTRIQYRDRTTGGAVRLTKSGLGCPTWPRCTAESVVPHAELGIHGVIEFGNRMLTWVLTVIAIATVIAIWRRRPIVRFDRRLSVLLALGIPFQESSGHHRAHRPQPVGGGAAFPVVDGLGLRRDVAGVPAAAPHEQSDVSPAFRPGWAVICPGSSTR